MKTLVRLLLQVLFRTRVNGLERLRLNGPALILPNHVSFLDAVFLYAYLPGKVCFVVNVAIAAKIGFVLRWINHVAVDPLNPYSLKRIVGEIKAGRPVVLFPEGRITTTGGLMKVYSGVGFIALKTGAALYPVIFLGSELSKVSRISDKVRSRWFPRVEIHIGTARRLSVAGGKSYRLQKKEVSDKLLAILQESLFAARQQHQRATNLFDVFLAAGRRLGMGRRMAEDVIGAVNYRQATIASFVLGARLHPLLAKEQTVGVMLPNSIAHVVALLALCYLGKTPAIINFSAGAANNLSCAETTGVATILTARAFIEKGNFQEDIRQLAGKFRILYLEDLKAAVSGADKLVGLIRHICQTPAKPGPEQVILFTSGSESKPKGVVLRQANILANINQIAGVIDYTPRDKMLNALPMFHALGLTAGTLLPILEGIEVFLYPTPLHYKIIPEIAYDRNITLLLGTPTFLKGYARYAHNYDFYSLRYAIAGGEKLNPEVRQIWQDKFGIRLLEGYGTTETAPVLSLNTPLFNRSGTAGKFLPGVEWRLEPVAGITDGGNLFVRGPNVMDGYLLAGQGFVPKPEWYDCGDVVSVDSDGFVTIKSRLKRFAKISGEMISLDAVERAVEQCFGTEGHAAINLPDPKKGEKILLYTTDRQASRQVLREYLTQTRQNMLALPAEVVVVEKLPVLGSGKPDYVTLKARALRMEGSLD